MESITAYTAQDFADWLAEHHDTESKVAIILYKRHTKKDAPTHRELLNEALCWGWVDTTIKGLDDDRYIRHFSRRTEKSTWSNNTLSYAEKLIDEGRMQASGLAFYQLGKQKPVHDDGIPKNPDMPQALAAALAEHPEAGSVFERYPPSTKRMLYRWILSGKQEATRTKRIQKIIDDALQSGSVQ